MTQSKKQEDFFADEKQHQVDIVFEMLTKQSFADFYYDCFITGDDDQLVTEKEAKQVLSQLLEGARKRVGR